jgi:hypothetical protein
MIGRAIQDAGIPMEQISGRTVLVGGVYVAGFQHASRNERAGAIDATSNRVRDFCRNPRRVLVRL